MTTLTLDTALDRGVASTTKSCLAGLGAVLPRSRVWNQPMDRKPCARIRDALVKRTRGG